MKLNSKCLLENDDQEELSPEIRDFLSYEVVRITNFHSYALIRSGMNFIGKSKFYEAFGIDDKYCEIGEFGCDPTIAVRYCYLPNVRGVWV